jgi:iron complex outermembrane receptor protein
MQRIAVVAGIALLVVRAAAAQTTEQLKRLDLQGLMDLEVTTVSRMPQPQSETPAAVTVITQDDIRRAGVTSLVEALRLVPGVQVARIDSSRWAVGIRGFADRLARSVLVLIDGRAVYSPLFAGTYWEVQDTLIEDVDRIEVIRGPGGTLWGANAVNGIINIITRDAADTQGVLAEVTAGNQERVLSGVRFGGSRGERLHYRIYGKAFTRDAEFHPTGAQFDQWSMGQGGFRADTALANGRKLTVQGDVYRSTVGEQSSVNQFDPPASLPLAGDATLAGGNLLGRWSTPAAGGAAQLQVFYDWTRRDELQYREVRHTVDVDFQHSLHQRARQHLLWGAGFRSTSSETAAPPGTTNFVPPQRTDNLASAFVQDEVTFASGTVRLTGGSKFEHNDYTGFEAQPSASLVWAPTPTHTVVVSATRAVRTPSRVERDLSLYSYNASANIFLHLVPNPDFASEKLTSYEAEYRVRVRPNLLLTSSSFLNHHRDLLSTEVLPVQMEADPGPPHLVLPLFFANGLHGESHGGEFTADFRPLPAWRLTAAYSYVRILLERNPGSGDVSQERRGEGGTPTHQLQVVSSVDLPRHVGVEWLFRAVSALPAFGVARYATSDVNLSWVPVAAVELSLTGRNLQQARHVEFENGAEITRSVAVRARVRW